jgi:hypothetical protein
MKVDQGNVLPRKSQISQTWSSKTYQKVFHKK